MNPYAGLTADDWPRASERKTYEWSDREIEVLLIAAWESVSETTHLILFAAVSTGLRLSELLGLRWKDVDIEEGVLHVRHQLSRAGSYEEPKTAAGKRRVPLFADIADALVACRFASDYPDDDDPVFARVDGKPLYQRGVQRGFDNAREKARKRVKGGFRHDDDKPVTFHDLRHAFASRCASRGVPIGALSAFMGHANVGITQSIYTHLYGREEAEQAFREAMNGSEIGKSLSSTDPE